MRTWPLHAPDGGCVGELRWVQDAQRRAETGWWLRPADARRAQRLRIDPAVERLAGDRASPEQAWHERADAARSLTVAIALTVAEARLDPRTIVAEGRPRSAVRRYEIYVDGAGVQSLGLAFPGLATTETGSMVLLSGLFDDAELLRTVQRLRTLGCVVAGYVAVSDRR